MKVMFVVSHLHLSGRLGPLQLMAICREHGHEARLVTLTHEDLVRTVRDWQPDVVAYSAMSPEVPGLRSHDTRLQTYLATSGQKVVRIMGGPHPTYVPSVLDDMKLAAICRGEGDHALPVLLARVGAGEPLTGIPNIAVSGNGAMEQQIVEDLDGLPFPARDDLYRIMPHYRRIGLRTVMASRGCPYRCSFCFNHAFTRMFGQCGPLVRRRSVDNLLAELEMIVERYPPVRMVRFADDVFTRKADEWLIEFAEQYRRRIGIPFYCMLRAEAFTPETAELLAGAGCYSINMGIECADDRIRNEILKKGVTSDNLVRAFALAKKLGIRVFANTMIAIPGTGVEDDLASLRFARSLRPEAPTFSICCPYSGTDLWQYAVDRGLLGAEHVVYHNLFERSMLNNYTERDHRIHTKISALGTAYVLAPQHVARAIYQVIASPRRHKLLCIAGKLFEYQRLGMGAFGRIVPRSPITYAQLVRDTIRAEAIFSPTREQSSVIGNQ
jgi:radical SAM superfamily enzyme YgiQ (UPF0313 family)